MTTAKNAVSIGLQLENQYLVCVCVCVCVRVYVCWRKGEQLFGWWQVDSPLIPVGENSAIPEIKLGQKSQKTKTD